MRILHLVQSLDTGGLEVLLERIVNASASLGVSHTVVSFQRGGAIGERMASAGMDVRLLGPNLPTLGILKEIRRIAKSTKAQVLHMHGLPAGTFGRIATIGLPLRRIYHLHTSVGEAHRPTKSMIWRERQLMRFTDRVVVISRSVGEEYQETFGIPVKKMVMLSGGVPEAPEVSEREKFVVRSELGISGSSWFLICVASLTEHKNQQLLLHALVSLPEAVLVLVGEGPKRKELEALARTLNVDTRVRFVGNREDIHRLLASADLNLLVSRREGLGLTLIEGMRAGVVNVGVKVGGIPEVITHEENGWLVEPDNVPALVDEVIHLMNHPTKRFRLREKARQTFLSEFELNVYVHRLHSLYKGEKTQW